MEDERPPPLRLLYADELGQLKVVQTADGAQPKTAAVAAVWGTPDKTRGVDCMALGSAGGIGDTATAVLAVARRCGTVELLSPLTGDAVGSIPAAPPAATPSSSGSGGTVKKEDAARVRGLHLLWGGSGGARSSSALPVVLSVTQGGTARVHVPPEQPSGAWEQLRSWQVPPNVCCTAYDADSGRLAVGCEGAELRLFDAATGELAFQFKGGKPNRVGLCDKPWNTAIAFLPASDGGSGSDGSDGGGGGGGGGGGSAGSRLLVGTGYHKVRLYDSGAGKRPQMEVAWGEGRITCLALEPDGQRCWVGNGLGAVEVLDLEARRFSGAVKGLSGSARSLAVHPDGDVLASAGLDRYLRLSCTRTRRLLAKVYLKTLPTGVAFCPADASMLAPLEQPAAEGKEAAARRRRWQDAGGSDDSEEEEEEEEGVQQRTHKRSKQRGEGSGGRRHKSGKRSGRPREEQ